MALQITRYNVKFDAQSYDDVRTVLFISKFDNHSSEVAELTGTIEEIAKHMIGLWATGNDEFDDDDREQIDEHYDELVEEYEPSDILEGVMGLINGDDVYALIYKN